MKIRIIQKTPHEDAILFPGTVLTVDDATADEWIKDGFAIAFENEPKAKEKKAVNDGR